MNPWSTKARRFRVGLLLLGSGVLLVGLLAFVLGRGLVESLVEYRILFTDSVKGMVVGSKVNFQGVPIGSVADIRFVRGKTLVTIRVDAKRAVVQTVTKARLDRLLVTGQVTIELEGYQDGAQTLPPRGSIESSPSPLDKLTKTVPDVLDQATRVLDGLENLLRRLGGVVSDDNVAAVTTTLSNLERASILLPRRVEEVLAEVTPLAADVRKTLVAVRTTTHDVGEIARSPDLVATLGELRRAAERLVGIEMSLLGTLEEAGGTLRASRSGLADALRGANGAVAELQRLLRELRLQPAALLFGRKLDAAAEPPKEGR